MLKRDAGTKVTGGMAKGRCVIWLAGWNAGIIGVYSSDQTFLHLVVVETMEA